MRRFLDRIFEADVSVESEVIGMGGLSQARMMLMRRSSPSLMLAMLESGENPFLDPPR